jgi:hypothetical protein
MAGRQGSEGSQGQTCFAFYKLFRTWVLPMYKPHDRWCHESCDILFSHGPDIRP